MSRTHAEPPDPEADADALLGGPWRADPMAIRLARSRGRLLIPPEVVALATDLIAVFPEPPDRDALVAFLAGWVLIVEPPPEEVSAPEHPRRHLEVPEVAGFLDIDASELAWFADAQGRERRSGSSALNHYRWRLLPKRDGVRLVAAPKSRLKEIQRRLLRHVVSQIPLHEAAHGCVPGRSVRTAVAPHVGAQVVIRLDLEAFFPTISIGRVRGVLDAVGVAEAELVAALATTAVPIPVWRSVPRPADAGLRDAHRRLGLLVRSPHLPQGAPTSPALANAVVYGLDRRLAGLAARFGGRYTRYVDDLTFSGGGFLATHRHRFLDAAVSIVRDEGFRVAERKTAVLTHAGRLSTLGAVFNDHPTIARPERDRLRAIVHNCVVHGGPSQARGRPQFRDELLGRIAAVTGLDPVFGARLRDRFEQIDWSA